MNLWELGAKPSFLFLKGQVRAFRSRLKFPILLEYNGSVLRVIREGSHSGLVPTPLTKGEYETWKELSKLVSL